ncbi:MAG: serine/threonine protein kinase [Pyrinomonadaceae bacterium]
MYCPKCKQTFEEGSRRFCPTDGSRLVSERSGGKEGGIFANLIPQMEGISDLDQTLRDTPRPAAQQPRPVMQETQGSNPDLDEDEILFELDDEPVKIMNESSFAQAAKTAKAAPKPEPRKVNPYEISDGGVNLADADRNVFTGDFDSDNPESFVGQTVKGRYLVTEFLGGDESGLSFLGDDRLVAERKVLVRILLDDASDEITESILAEERISLSHLSHPNIARLIDSGEFTNGTQFLVSEFVDALSVREIIDIHGRFDDARAARVVSQAADALNHAHQEGILHRDVRPENLIVNSDNDVEYTMLMNFGSSNGEPNAANASYKAPEVLDGYVATSASDIFSLGVVAYEMLTGRLPFTGESTREIAKQQSQGLVTRVTDIRPDLPATVDDVLAKVFAFDVATRYTKARDFGEAFSNALTDRDEPVQRVHAKAVAAPVVPANSAELVQETAPIAAEPAMVDAPAVPEKVEPMWTRRSPEPPQVEGSSSRWLPFAGLIAMLALLPIGWYYVANNQPSEPTPPVNGISVPDGPGRGTNAPNSEMPPLPRNLSQPPNTNFFQTTKQNLKGDLLLNFVGFSMYYPKDWKLTGPQPGASNTRGKFVDISRQTEDGRMKEQMLVSYYPSKGTFTADAEKFPQLVKETNDTLKKILPGYQIVSEGEIRFNGEWKAYEVKFQGSGMSADGQKLVVWGRRLFVPAARPGTRNGFEITMLATSLADEVKSVDDVGVKGELAPILFSFEPSQNF